MLVTLVLLAVAALPGCGGDDVGAPAADQAYDGPLYLPSDEMDKGDPLRRTGAAGEVVECRTPVTGGFSDGVYDNGAAADDPDGALDNARSEWGFDGAQDGFTVAAQDDDRALYVYEVDGVAKQALIVHDGETIDGDGWYLESWARCDWAEFPDEVTDEAGLLVWTDRSGERVSTREVVSYPGPEHCDWQDITFIQLGRTTYVDTVDRYARKYVKAEPQLDVVLPDDAVATGFSRDGEELWVSADRRWVYVGADASSVDAWPDARQAYGCE